MAEKYFSSAKVVDGVLILSLPDAVTPVVWQMEMGQSKSSALEIRNADNNQFILTLKTPRQDVIDIATYASKDQAMKALLEISKAMEKSQGHLKAQNGDNVSYAPRPADDSSVKKIIKNGLKFIGFLCAGVISIGILGFVAFIVVNSVSPNTKATATNEPVSAEEFLNQ